MAGLGNFYSKFCRPMQGKAFVIMCVQLIHVIISVLYTISIQCNICLLFFVLLLIKHERLLKLERIIVCDVIL